MLKKPGQFGFKRVVVPRNIKTTLDEFGNVVEEKQRSDIYYYPPTGTGKALRSSKEAEKYLSENQPEGLSLRNFSYTQKELGLGEFEQVRQTGSRSRENKTFKKKEASRTRNKPPEAAEIRENENKINIHFSCEELVKEAEIEVKRGKLLGKLMIKFSELAGMKGPDQLVFLCEGKKLEPSDRVDNLASRKIDVQLAELSAATEKIE